MQTTPQRGTSHDCTSTSAATHRRRRRRGALALAASFAAPSSTAHKSLPLLDRDAVEAIDQFGGARRFTGDQSAVIARSIEASRAKNVILIIGDGMGDSEITIARNYLLGAGEAFAGIDALPLTGNLTHYSVDKESGKPDYTPDSASSGSAWATGVKTYDNAISVDRHGKPYQTILQWAKTTGRATRRRVHVRDPRRDPRRAGGQRGAAQVLRPGRHVEELPRGRS